MGPMSSLGPGTSCSRSSCMVCDPLPVLPALPKEVSHCWTPPWSCLLLLGSASHCRCVLAESPRLAGVCRAHSICPCVPLSFSPGSLLPGSQPCQAGSLQHAGLAALQPSPVRSCAFRPAAGASFPFPGPKGASPALGAEFVQVWGAGKGGGSEGQEQGWLPALPRG